MNKISEFQQISASLNYVIKYELGIMRKTEGKLIYLTNKMNFWSLKMKNLTHSKLIEKI